jgi:hypothetical protein
VLPSGADVQIGDHEYVLARQEQGHYVHRFESLFANATAIAGEVAAQQLRPEKLLWSWTDWSGGEGARIYYPQDPTTYDVGSLINGTERGALTTRATRRWSSVARSGSNADTSSRPAGGSAWNKAMIAWEDNVIYSRDAASWAATAGITSGSGSQYYGANTDGRYLVVGKIVEGTVNLVDSIDGAVSTPTVADIFSGTTAINAPYVPEILDGNVYTWGLNASSALALVKLAGANAASAGTAIYASQVTPTGSFGTDYWIDIEQAEANLFMSLGTPSGSLIFTCENDVGRIYTSFQNGFCVKKLIYHEGVVFCLGARFASGKKFAEIVGLPLQTGNRITVARPRRHRNEQLPEFSIGTAGPGATVFAADENSGKIFIYDMEADALHLFDDLANGGTGDGVSFTPYGGLLPANVAGAEGATLAATGWTQEVANFLRSTTTPRDGSSHLTCGVGTGVGTGVTATGFDGIVVDPSTQYTLSAYHRIVNLSSQTRDIGIRWYSATGAFLSTNRATAVTDASATYAQMTVTATSPSTAAFAALECRQTAGNANGTAFDSFYFGEGSVVAQTDKLAFLAVHGSRLFGATYQPQTGTGTSLQVISWDDLLRENRDGTQPIEATVESATWDFGLPHEIKALTGIYLTFEVSDDDTASGLVEDSRVTVSYSVDGGAFVALDTVDADTESIIKGRTFQLISDGDDTVTFSRLKLKATLDNNSTSDTQPPVVFSVTAEAQLVAYAETWDLIVQLEDEDGHERPSSRQVRADELRDDLLELVTNRAFVTLLDGARYTLPGVFSTHTVILEDPTDIIDTQAQGTMRLRLRSVPV